MVHEQAFLWGKGLVHLISPSLANRVVFARGTQELWRDALRVFEVGDVEQEDVVGLCRGVAAGE